MVIKAVNINLYKQSITITKGGDIYQVQEDILKEINLLKYLSQDKQGSHSITKYIDSFQRFVNLYILSLYTLFCLYICIFILVYVRYVIYILHIFCCT